MPSLTKTCGGKVLDAVRSVNTSSADWFLKADDDTFVIFPRIEIEELVSQFDSNRPYYLGLHLLHTLQHGKQTEYMSGGAGYILSSSAVRMLQNTQQKECHYPGTTSYEDVNMGACMEALGVTYADTRDSLGRPVFLPYPPTIFFDPNLAHHPDYLWLQEKNKYPIQFGTKYLSDQVVSFHQIRNSVDFYLYQYLTQDLRLHAPRDGTPFSKLEKRH
ncbi:C1galt1p [Halocaridina rubra]|uniref:N-acetylgalactosaminide beta-1,3-galactosyltransferase n=1 Tax=Halocaridina rubra TaxID=373956 RepID=A0AAN9A9K9_HALRR